MISRLVRGEAPSPASNVPRPVFLSLRELSVELGGRKVLSDVTADIPGGQITALIGLNGSGKTTLLRAIIGECPYRGQIRFACGHNQAQPNPQHVGYVPQRLNIDARLPLTVRDLLALSLQRWPLFLGISQITRTRIAHMLERVGMAGFIDVPVEGLSGGQLQRVLLALAIDPQPELLLLDEPASGIDFKDQQRFYELIAELNAQTGVTVLLVSHELSMVSQHAHQVLCLRDGRIQCQGPPGEILRAEVLAQTFGTDMQLFHHQVH